MSDEAAVVENDSQENDIQVNSDPNVRPAEFAFRFKKDKLGNQRPKVEFKHEVPSPEGIKSILRAGGKQLDFLLDAMYDAMRGPIADYVAQNLNVNGENFPHKDFTWEAIANMPKEDRRSSTIPPELWEEFATDYVEVMPSVTGKSPEAVGNAVAIYLKKFSLVKNNKDILAKLQGQLAIYVDNSPKAENFQDILDLLTKRLDTYLKADDVEAMITNL